MPRRARVLIDGGTYHILTQGNNSQAIFHAEADYQRYLHLLSSYVLAHRLILHHFVLMPNHVHLALYVPVAATLSKAMLGLNLAYALFYRKRYRYHGHLWQGRFKSVLIDRDNSLLASGRHIELNPVRAGLAQNPGAYAWSSYRVYAHGVDNPLIGPHPPYELLGPTAHERQERYRQFVQEGLRPQRPHAAHTMAGIEDPMTHIENRFGLPVARRARGRPKKLLRSL